MSAKKNAPQDASPLAEAGRRWLAGQGLAPERVEPGLWGAPWQGEGAAPDDAAAGVAGVILAGCVDDDLAAVHVILPGTVPAARRAEAALMMMTFSQGEPVAALMLDPEDGEVRVRTGVDLTDVDADLEGLFATLGGHALNAADELAAALDGLLTFETGADGLPA